MAFRQRSVYAILIGIYNGGVGTTFRIVTDDRGKRMEFDGVVTEHDPPNSSTVRMIGKSFDIEAEYKFEDVGNNKTLVTQSSNVNGKGFFKIMFFCMGWMMKKSSCDALVNELNGLKKFVESSC